jgi:hypothetical protein
MPPVRSTNCEPQVEFQVELTEEKADVTIEIDLPTSISAASASVAQGVQELTAQGPPPSKTLLYHNNNLSYGYVTPSNSPKR